MRAQFQNERKISLEYAGLTNQDSADNLIATYH